MPTPLKLVRYEQAFEALTSMAAEVKSEKALQAALASLPQTLIQLGYLQTVALLDNRQDVEKVILQKLIAHVGAFDASATNTQLREITVCAVRFAHSMKVLSKRSLACAKDALKVANVLNKQDLADMDKRHSALSKMPPHGMHHGLKFDKFFDLCAESKTSSEWRRKWVSQFEKFPIGDATTIKAAHADLSLIAEQCLRGSAISLTTSAPLAVGLGYENAIENGMLWHHTLGVPYLPASSVKGMLRAWMSEWADDADDADTSLVDDWFGTTKQVGKLTVLDALPAKPVYLQADVTTPHWGTWGEKLPAATEDIAAIEGNKNGDKANAAADSRTKQNFPTDWIDPKPVHWLRMNKDTPFVFYVALKHKDPDDKAQVAKDNTQVKKHLEDALRYIGAGAKTATGYGRFEPSKTK